MELIRPFSIEAISIASVSRCSNCSFDIQFRLLNKIAKVTVSYREPLKI